MRHFLTRALNGGLELVGRTVGKTVRAADERGLVYFPYASQALAALPFSAGTKLRAAAYRSSLLHVGDGTVIHHGVVFDDAAQIIGSDVWISAGCYIERADIGDHVLIGPHAVLLAGSYHRYDRVDVPIKQQGNKPRQTLRIGAGAWIGANATVMADVGHDAIVAAGAVVTKPVAPFAIVGGNPARLIRMRPNAPATTTATLAPTR